jgi:hypothetical protein
MNQIYKGTIVEESLTDNRIINNLKIVRFRISKDENPSNRWHLYTVNANKEEIQKVSRYINSGKWYMHFWSGNDVIAVFKDKIFEFKYDQKETWKGAIDYGRSLGIPDEQLDFVVE